MKRYNVVGKLKQQVKEAARKRQSQIEENERFVKTMEIKEPATKKEAAPSSNFVSIDRYNPALMKKYAGETYYNVDIEYTIKSEFTKHMEKEYRDQLQSLDLAQIREKYQWDGVAKKIMK